MAKLSLSRRETITDPDEVLNSKDDGARSAIYIDTAGQLNYWIEKDSDAVVEAIQHMRKYANEIAVAHNEVVDRCNEKEAQIHDLRKTITIMEETMALRAEREGIRQRPGASTIGNPQSSQTPPSSPTAGNRYSTNGYRK